MMKPATYDSCQVCAGLWDLFMSDTRNHRKLPHCYGSSDKSCPGHDAFSQYIMKLFPEYIDGPYLRRMRPDGPVGVKLLLIGPDPENWFAICEPPEGSQLSCYGRILDPGWIDVELIKGWIKDCITFHEDTCANPVGVPPVSPQWLIDVQDACIIPGGGIPDYVALSYRWGASKGLRRGEGSLDIKALRKPGALAEAQIVQILPPTIADALQLVDAIGERYLWVDAICIDQSDEAHLNHQLEIMGAIATDGDSTSGIKGLKGISTARDLQQDIIPLFEHFKIVRTLPCDFRNVPVLTEDEHFLGYFRRGWTHQEFHLSKRRLIFYKKQIFWQCTCANWSEDLIQEMTKFSKFQYHRGISLQDSSLLKGIPNLDNLSRILADYNSREHSYPEDALPGIMGLLSILSRTFEGGFLCGLPETCFDAALMWRVGGPRRPTRRRIASKKSSTVSLLPSWSWVGWQTPSLLMAPNENLAMLGLEACRTIPITQWFTHDSPHSDSKRPIESKWFSFRKSMEISPASLPSGWWRYEDGTRDGLPSNVVNKLGYNPRYFYCHKEIAGIKYYLPFPISTNYKDQIPWSPRQTPFISCKTKRGWFKARREGLYDPLNTEFMLSSSDGFDDCGRLESHTAIDTLLAATASGQLTVELVAICSQILISFHMFMDLDWHKVYGVLWVEWVDGVAYRRGSGVVYKEAWEAHDLEDVDLILG
ncbi:heterokaryon incompatibility protein-domain-containing protein [Xylaria bambusicola]|uniref:heterokaryon incompatibility protein-domain-containing protein n=1 Tax=Xylaria bambusicola TaxID=326684 RepID=UPI002007EC19|nr:heterokaryon incompatibility protein-domain-containing protein [Xylaria bambusicola]KAI0509252.1 heterokaryon incompatibility protein-domain-containing protein [Xylaria bambusicola]